MIIPMGCLYGLTVEIGGVSYFTDFEVIEIMDDNNPYLAILGIDLAFYMDAVNNLKRWRMKFEKKVLRVIVPLDLAEGAHYTKLVQNYHYDDDLD